MAETVFFRIAPEEEGIRVDRYLATVLPDRSRTYLQKLIRDGAVLRNGKETKAGTPLLADDTLEVILPELQEVSLVPEEIPLDILYEDDDLLVVNKPQGMVVHPAAGHDTGTLVHAILHHCRGKLSGINGVLRPGIVHRIDKDTSGALVVCKTDTAHRALAEELAAHRMIREYRAILHGTIREDVLTWTGNIGRDPRDRKRMAVVPEPAGKPAVTHVQVLQRYQNYTYVACRLETGRTHQIRVHAAHAHHPVVGDPIYGPARCPFPELKGQVLHAYTLGFPHPLSGEEILCTAPLPESFERLLQKLESCAIL